MDVVIGNTLVFTLNGTLQGSARVVPGLYDKALYISGISGARVDYGVQSGSCFFDPDLCIQGITMSFWLMVHEIQDPQFDIIFDNGGCQGPTIGYCFYLKLGDIKVSIKHRSGLRVYILPVTNVNQWHYVTLTYKADDENVYVNGCDSAPFSFSYGTPRPEPYTSNYEFHLGDWSRGGFASYVTIDEMMVWYKSLTADQIWQLYVQGGRVWISISTDTFP